MKHKPVQCCPVAFVLYGAFSIAVVTVAADWKETCTSSATTSKSILLTDSCSFCNP